MFVAVNINNLAIEFAVVNDDAKIVSRFAISTIEKKTADQYIAEVRNVLDYMKVDVKQITHAAILSVVPKFGVMMEDFFKKDVRINPIMINNDFIEMPAEVEISNIPTDILARSYTANKIYGSNVIVVNFDSVITISVVVNDKFVGYSAYPGEDILASSIHEKISNFPEVLVKPTNACIGVNKYDALNAGIFQGMMGACDNIIACILEQFSTKQFQVVAVSNNDIIRYCRNIEQVDADLNIKSIIEIAKKTMFLR